MEMVIDFLQQRNIFDDVAVASAWVGKSVQEYMALVLVGFFSVQTGGIFSQEQHITQKDVNVSIEDIMQRMVDDPEYRTLVFRDCSWANYEPTAEEVWEVWHDC